MDFLDAVKLLAERARLDLPDSADSPEVDRTLKERVYAANLAGARYFHDVLWTSAGAQVLDYLHRRALDDGDIRRFGLGASTTGWDDLTNELTRQGFEEDVLVRSGLTVRKDQRRFDMFRSRAMFPIIDAQGRVLGFGGRAMGDAQPKYLNTGDSPVFNKRQNLYAMNFVRKERSLDKLILVEGYMDVLALRRAGVPGVVATLGTALTEEQARIMKRYAPETWVAYDGDAPGQKATLRALDILEAAGIPCRALVFPDGMDPDDFIRREGPEGFGRLSRWTVQLPAGYLCQGVRSHHPGGAHRLRDQGLRGAEKGRKPGGTGKLSVAAGRRDRLTGRCCSARSASGRSPSAKGPSAG